MFIICHPSISSKDVLVSPQGHRGIIYPYQDPEINDTPLSLWLTRKFVLLPRKSTVILYALPRTAALSVVGMAL